MKPFVCLFTVFSLLVLCSVSTAEILPIGNKSPVWKDLPGVDGKKHSLSDLKEAKAVLVVFFANSCPDCDMYFERIIDVAKDYKPKGVATVLLNVNLVEEDKLPAMKEYAKKKKLAVAYLFDESQKIGRAFGAELTPEVFLLDSKRRLVYHGSVDDHWKSEKVKRKHLRIALDETLAGKKVSKPTTEAEGCHIFYEEKAEGNTVQ